MNLRKSILSLLLATSILFVGGMGWIVYQQSARNLTHQLQGESERAAFLISQRLVEQSERLTSQARLVAGMPFVQAAISTRDVVRIRRATRDMVRDTGVDLVAFHTPDGKALAAFWSDAYTQADDQNLAPTLPETPPPLVYLLVDGESMFHGVSVPVNAGGKLLGYVTMAAALNERFLDNVTVAANGHALLYLDGEPSVHDAQLDITGILPLVPGESPAVQLTIAGDPWHQVVSAPLAMLSGRVRAAVLLPQVEEMAQLETLRRTVLFYALAGFLVLALLGWLFVDRLTKPLESLTRAADDVAAGNLDKTVPEEGVGEIGTLSRAFNAMVGAISERDRELLRHTTNLEALREGASDAIFVLDLKGNVVAANSKACKWVDMTPKELIGTHICEVMVDPQMCITGPLADPEALAGEVVFEMELIGSGAGPIPVEVNCGPVKGVEPPVVQLFARDLSERTRLRAQLLRAQKLEAIGTLAGGIAHDFNNLLTGIAGYAALARMDLPDEHPAQPSLATVEETVERGASLCRQLLSAARKGRPRTGPVEMNTVVEEAVSLCQHTFPPAIGWELNLGENLPATEADADQLHQVFINLLVNARDAIGDHPGILTITTERVPVAPDQPLARSEGLEPGDYLAATIRDSGPGIAKEDMERIFDPFFTTKEVGKGTGLGLSTVFGIAGDHGGTVVVDSSPGLGAAFTCYFPVSTGVAIEETHPLPISPIKDGVATGRRILIVDDEPSVRELLKSALITQGHEVIAAENGLQAVSLVADSPEQPPDLAVVDMLMPGMNGRETVQALRKQIPGLPVIFATGYMGEDVTLDDLGEPVPQLMLKPFRIAKLIETVTETLG